MYKTTSDAAVLSLALDRTADEPLQVQLSGQLRRHILTGRFRSGSRLPSSRALAADLAVSRVTVVAAVDQLISEGYAESRHGSGVYVSTDLPDHVLQLSEPAPSSSNLSLQPPPRPRPVRPFQTGSPDAALFPHRDWARLLDRVWRSPGPALLATADPLGWAPLRTAIADHLGLWRGISCSARQIVITSGAVEAISLLARAAFAPDDRVLVEDPGYSTLRRALELNGLIAAPVSIDDQGFDINAAGADRRPAAGAVITPSRQYPLGVTLPLPRRLALLDWARRNDGLIIEDDYDSEYRYHGRPLPALMSLDDGDCVAYIGSFSKVLSASLRLGFLVVPVSMTGAVSAAMEQTGPSASLVPQPVLARFMTNGDFAAHIRRTRRVYARRQTALVAALRTHTGKLLDIEPAPAGMHIVAGFKRSLLLRMGDTEAAARAAEVGLSVRALSSYYAGEPHRQGLVLGYAGFDEAAIAEGVERLSRVLV
jgi:GntR family transcriptional regulator/MocR family aminotransferase